MWLHGSLFDIGVVPLRFARIYRRARLVSLLAGGIGLLKWNIRFAQIFHQPDAARMTQFVNKRQQLGQRLDVLVILLGLALDVGKNARGASRLAFT